ncbi:protein-L-isoaspartate O-methyltransferase [Marinicauda pacifica]|uniref:Protein-L-isoaspartate O-methyltransferase n=1 Tax=Marinicauda pacifica TaxID=1133559 RepID=A0A4S2HEJ4_9PROT|nr:protein-L-isoaspartate(D-aspartate) O-methyltransferase [Marinicauda pacifica]TGY94221.1 protein-L-isoaspartate(D-aspartate) O-methyltransferase [Marinicauda pacifica]GGE33953.1 protein-L-isoaspartate O-methyltransferase [Marinicauda pacifica]
MADAHDPRSIQLVMALRRAGITDKAVLSAMERTPRNVFVAEGFLDQAYENRPLPIDCGQTISQPYIVAMMTEALKVDDRCKVLEIGTGSGYQAAILARLSRRVYTIERYRTLMKAAEERFAAQRLTNIVTRIGDGSKGWPEQAPFDRIMVTAAAPERPETLLDQLKDGGICVAPVQNGPVQTLMRYQRDGDAVQETTLGDVRFVPLVAGAAKAL